MRSSEEMVQEVVQHLEKSIGGKIVEECKKSMQQLVAAEFKEQNRKLDSIDRIVTQIAEDLADDRKDFAHIKTTLASIDQGLRELVDMNSKQTKTIVSKVNGEIEKVPDLVAEQVENKVPKATKQGIKEYMQVVKPRVVQIVQKPRSFWDKIFKRG